MPAISFQNQFAEPIRLGEKTTTIRQIRRGRPIRVGDTLHLFTGMRTRACERIGTTRCVSVTPIDIFPDTGEITLNGMPCSQETVDQIVHRDGFASAKDFFAFFESKYGNDPGPMLLIEWKPLENSS